MEAPETIITVCMGSSCFSRGNNVNTEIIDRFLRDHDLACRVELRGCLCSGRCKDAPVIEIDNEVFRGVQPGMLADLLTHKLLGAQ